MKRDKKNEVATVDPGALDAVAKSYGTVSTPAANEPEVSSGGGCNWLHFYREGKKRAEEQKEAVGEVYLGKPLARIDGEYVSLEGCSYLVLGDPQYYYATTLNGPPIDAWLEDPGVKKHDGQTVKTRGVGVLLILPNAEGEGPCAPVMYEAQSWTTLDVFTQHVAKVRTNADSPKVIAATSPDIPAGFRLASQFRVTAKPAGKVPPYAVVRTVTRPIAPAQYKALSEFFASGMPGLTECEEAVERKMSEVAELAAETAKRTG